MSYVPPPDDLDAMEVASSVRSPEKAAPYRDPSKEMSPDTASTSKMSSFGSPASSIGTKRSVGDISDPPPLKRASIAAGESEVGGMSLKSEPKTVSATDRQANFQDLISLDSEDEEDAEDEDEMLISGKTAEWDNIEQQQAWFKHNYNVEDNEVPECLIELTTANINKLKSPDLSVAIDRLNPKAKYKPTAARMKTKLKDMVHKALEKKSKLSLTLCDDKQSDASKATV